MQINFDWNVCILCLKSYVNFWLKCSKCKLLSKIGLKCSFINAMSGTTCLSVTNWIVLEVDSSGGARPLSRLMARPLVCPWPPLLAPFMAVLLKVRNLSSSTLYTVFSLVYFQAWRILLYCFIYIGLRQVNSNFGLNLLLFFATKTMELDPNFLSMLQADSMNQDSQDSCQDSR